MRKFISIAATVVTSVAAEAQEVSSIKNDTMSYVKSKRMSDADLAKKREGTFVTGIPDISSDPVTGFGFGVRSNFIWNGKRDNELFA
ncbi:DUF5982 domain-containing protein [Elizabethkingia miricola]|uniref:DUF5982 domain-containing protein n=1 Tax=Elizabethkingia miricola TaxID=172045 RepID=UPI000B28E01E|nr:DUF5982 domain-containing protein [Elizabethkingia miricola]